MCTTTLNGQLHLAPVTQAHRVLDVGTGTGIWAIDFADEHPESQVNQSYSVTQLLEENTFNIM